jgi:2-succinyl-5-enolpyruvyl-6-hydroxy-3-cyclohexene-1-carboxylate synthase
MWAETLIDSLVAQGITRFVISPGSRSTPLTLAVARHPAARHTIAYDERGAAYFAVGYARATGRPAALVCTSGTAAANYLPAVTEASHDALPMVVLTADRPPERHGIGANQTIDQQNLYGGFVRAFVNVSPEDQHADDGGVRDVAGRSVAASLFPVPGPVHINCMFREPFQLKAPSNRMTYQASSVIPSLSRDLDSGVGLRLLDSARKDRRQDYAKDLQDGTRDRAARIDLIAKASRAEHPLLLVGDMATARDREAALALARHLQWPVWADIRSGLRTERHLLVSTCDLASQISVGPLARDVSVARAFCPGTWHDARVATRPVPGQNVRATEEAPVSSRELPVAQGQADADDGCPAPDVILHLGGSLISKPLNLYLQNECAGAYVKVPGDGRKLDPTGSCTMFVGGSVAAVCDELIEGCEESKSARAALDSSDVHDHLRSALQGESRDGVALSEPAVAYLLSCHFPPDSALFLGNSMPVRFCDEYGLGPGLPARVAANRGVSGIDGTLASACGFSAGCERPVVCVLGDLSFIHDMSSLSLLAAAPHPLLVVVVNNRGGGIFHHLPIAEQGDVFREFFTTPHPFNFEGAAKQFGLAYSRVETTDAFVARLADPGIGGGHQLIEVSVDQESNMAAYSRMAAVLRGDL